MSTVQQLVDFQVHAVIFAAGLKIQKQLHDVSRDRVSRHCHLAVPPA